MGEFGCGYEMPLEAMNRFLVDPVPYQSLLQTNDGQMPVGIDQVVLDQRAAFLRPDSIVGVVLLSDENDCREQEPVALEQDLINQVKAARRDQWLKKSQSALDACNKDIQKRGVFSDDVRAF